MHGASRESLSAAAERLEALLEATDADPVTVGGELFAAADLLDAQASLRAALTDPARSGDDRAGLAASILGGRLSEAAVDLVTGTVRGRWSSPRDLADGLDELGVRAILVSAQRHQRLDAVEDDLFRFARLLEAQPQLRSALSDRAAAADRKASLVTDLLDGKAAVESVRLVSRAIAHPRGRSIEKALSDIADSAAALRQRLVATVTAAVPLTEAQRDRLAAALSAQFGHDVHLNVVVDPTVVGGVRIALGDEVIDGTISTRLDEAARRLAS